MKGNYEQKRNRNHPKAKSDKAASSEEPKLVTPGNAYSIIVQPLNNLRPYTCSRASNPISRIQCVSHRAYRNPRSRTTISPPISVAYAFLFKGIIDKNNANSLPEASTGKTFSPSMGPAMRMVRQKKPNNRLVEPNMAEAANPAAWMQGLTPDCVHLDVLTATGLIWRAVIVSISQHNSSPFAHRVNSLLRRRFYMAGPHGRWYVER